MKYKMSRSSGLFPSIFQLPCWPFSRLHLTLEKCVTKNRTTKARTMARRQNSRRHKKANLKSPNSNSDSSEEKPKEIRNATKSNWSAKM